MIVMDENTELLKRIADELGEMKVWLKIAGLPNLLREINNNLRSDEEKIVYELSDGKRSTRDIVSELKNTGKSITHATVANMWKKWAVVGLVAPSERYKGRFRKIVPLESLGIGVQIIKKKR